MSWKNWQGLWKATLEPAIALPPWPIVERLVPMLDSELRRTCSTYKWRTGLSLNQLHPRHLGLYSNDCLYKWGYFFYSCEVSGLWASPMEFFSFFLFVESRYVFRTIGLLSDTYHIWAKIRGEGFTRSYLATGVGKSTEDAIRRVLLV